MSKTNIFLTVIGVILFAIAAKYAQIAWTKHFSPMEQDVQRQVFQETKSYNEGKLQQLAKYRLEYLQSADQDSKDAIASTVRSMFADFDTTNMPDNALKTWILQIRGY